jgi:transcriptional regulator with AAA-type ATPase domain
LEPAREGRGAEMTRDEDSTHEDSIASQRQKAALRLPFLFLALECDRPTSGGARYGLAGVDEVVIGRGTERRASRHVVQGHTRLDIRVPGRSMSALHARFVPGVTGWVLEDAGSTNGSFVNGYRVERAQIGDGDIVELGHTLFLVRGELPSASPPPNDLDSSQMTAEPLGFATLLPHPRRPFDDLARVAASSLPILLLGETGTGKEVMARSVHTISGRGGPFIAVNCGALPPNLVESHLFGHVRGAFSGATRDEPGALRSADGGTLLLDEIGDLPRAAQPSLLRFLQESEVTPVGSARPIRVNVRVVSATHRPLAQLVDAGDFRADLLARLSGFVHTLSDLRSRREDLGLLMQAILVKHGLHGRQVSITPPAGRRLLSHTWPGNIRELEHAIQRAFTIADRDRLDESHFRLDASALPNRTVSDSDPPGKPWSKADTELRKALAEQLELHGGNVADVARAMGRARMQIYRWLRRFDLDPERFRRDTTH